MMKNETQLIGLIINQTCIDVWYWLYYVGQIELKVVELSPIKNVFNEKRVI